MADTTTRRIDGTLTSNQGSVMARSTSAERMRALRQRRAQGIEVPCCSSCSRRLDFTEASPGRIEARLCGRCWQQTEAGRAERRGTDQDRYWSDPARRADVRARVARHRARKSAKEAGQ